MGRFHHHTHDDEHSDDHTHSDHDHTRDDDHPLGDHSGYETGTERVMVLEQILSENDRVAEANRSDLAASRVRTVNLMSSPGGGQDLTAGQDDPGARRSPADGHRRR